jgi:hypothetical protein
VNPVSGETCIINNRESVSIAVVSSSAQSKILIVSSDVGSYHVRGTSLPEFELAVQSKGYNYDVWTESINGSPSLEFLQSYSLVIWTCGDFSSRAVNRGDAETLKSYLTRGGNILIEGENVAENNPDSYSDLWSSVLHVSGYLGPNIAPGLTVVDSNHPIVQGLPSNLIWDTKPRSPDSVKASNGAYAILGYTNYDYAAVVIFDGTPSGIGSVVYYSFPLYCIEKSQVNTLVANSIQWLMRYGVSTIISKIIHASKDAVYFVYSDTAKENPIANSGIIPGCMLYTFCHNSQLQGFTTTEFWFLEDGKVNMTEVNSTVIAMFGNPSYHKSVKYYENAEMTPIRMSQNSTHYVFVGRAGDVIASLPFEAIESGKEDMFVIYIFEDGNVDFLVMYGLSWKGEWGCGIFLTDVIMKDLGSFSADYYIFHWNDSNGDGVPQFSEMEKVAQG